MGPFRSFTSAPSEKLHVGENKRRKGESAEMELQSARELKDKRKRAKE